MANEATLSLKLDLRALNAGFKAALSMGQNFSNQLNGLLSGKTTIDLTSFDRALADYEAKLNAASGQNLDVDERPAVSGMENAADTAEKTGKRIRNDNLQTAASFAQIATGIKSAIGIITQFIDTVDRFIMKGADSEQSNLKLTASLKNSGIYTDEFNAKLNKHIDSLRELTGVDDDYIKQQTRMMLNMHTFSQEELPAVISAATGLTTAFDVDLKTAMQMLAKAADGLPVRLANFGIATKGAEDATASFAELLQKGNKGLQQTVESMDSVSGKLIKNKSNLGEVIESFSMLINIALEPVINLINMLSGALNKSDTALKFITLSVGVLTTLLGSYLLMVKGVILAKKAWVVVSALLNGVLKGNPLYLLISIVLAVSMAIYSVIKSNEKLIAGWKIVMDDGKAAFKILWDYIKGFAVFIYEFGNMIAKLLRYPFEVMWNTAKDVFGRIAGMMKKLIAGDFKGVWEDINRGMLSSWKLGFAEANKDMAEQAAKTAEAWDKIGKNASGIWANRHTTITMVDIKAKGGDVKTPAGGETEEEKKAREKAEADRKAAVEAYYDYMKFNAADYEQYMLDKYTAESMAFLKMTKNQEQADSILMAKLKELERDKIAFEKDLRENAIKEERAPFEAARVKIEEHMKRLENWKSLGLNVAQDLKKTWDDYFKLLKGRMQDSESAYINAADAKEGVTAEEVATLKAIYDQDYDNYITALDKKRQADLAAADAIIDKWKENHKTATKTITGIKAGFDTMWDSILDKQMSGKKRADAIWKSMLGSWMSSLGDFMAKRLEDAAYDLLMTGVFEKSKTAILATEEAKRAGIHKATVMESIATDIFAGIKYVAIKLWETFAGLMKFYSFLGPFAPVAAGGTMALIVPAVMAMRKGFKRGGYTGDGDPGDVAGLAHKKEIYFEEPIATPNASALLGLRAMLQKGYKLTDLLIPNMRLPWAPVPQMSYSYAGGGQANGNLEGMIRNVVRSELSGLEMKANVAITDRMLVVAVRLIEKGKKLINVLG